MIRITFKNGKVMELPCNKDIDIVDVIKVEKQVKDLTVEEIYSLYDVHSITYYNTGIVIVLKQKTEGEREAISIKYDDYVDITKLVKGE